MQPRAASHRAAAIASVGIAAIVLVGLATVGPVLAAVPTVEVHLSVTPNPTIPGSQVTWIVTVAPHTGVAKNVMMHLEGTWAIINEQTVDGSCSPSALCTVDARTGNPQWTLPSVTKKMTLRYTTLAWFATTTLWIDNDAALAWGTAGPPRATLRGPTLSVSVSDGSPGTVMPGDTLHVTIVGSTDVGPVAADLQGILSKGFAEPPSNVHPSTATWSSASYHGFDDDVALNRRATLSFDVRVTASVGTTVSITGRIGSTVTKTLKIKVGQPPVTPRPPPTPTPRPTPKSSATPKPTAITHPSASPESPTLAPPSASSAVASPAASLEAVASQVLTSSPDLVMEVPSPEPSLRPNDLASSLGAAAPAIAISVVVIGGIGAIAWVLRRR